MVYRTKHDDAVQATVQPDLPAKEVQFFPWMVTFTSFAFKDWIEISVSAQYHDEEGFSLTVTLNSCWAFSMFSSFWLSVLGSVSRSCLQYFRKAAWRLTYLPVVWMPRPLVLIQMLPIAFFIFKSRNEALQAVHESPIWLYRTLLLDLILII